MKKMSINTKILLFLRRAVLQSTKFFFGGTLSFWNDDVSFIDSS